MRSAACSPSASPWRACARSRARNQASTRRSGARRAGSAGSAGGFLVLGGGAARYLPATTHGLAVEGRPSIDPTRRLGDVRFSGIAASPLASDTATLRTLATLLAAAEAVGVAERALEDSVEY